jgi:hypothetical protein
MKSLLSSLLCAATLAFAAPAPAADLFTPRVFDIVPPEGREVQMVDGLTVLRQPGKSFGAVVTFMPESGVAAWIPLAVLNTGGAPLDVGTDDISARYGDSVLKVWSTAGLVKEGKERRDDMLRYKPGTHGGTTRDRIRASTAGDPTLGARPSTRTTQAASNDEYEARDLADAQFEALKARLFKDETLAPRGVAQGDVRIDLPPRREDGQPTEFVLTLAFGGETMDVLFRERDPNVQVGDPIPDRSPNGE